jgi:RimJ/RimL family protein N-acetyltransferase
MNAGTQPPTMPAAHAGPDIAPPPDALCLDTRLTLRDGAIVRMRAIRPDDMDRLRRLHSRLSADAIVFRFFRMLPQLSEEMAERFTHVDYMNRMALVATVGSGEAEEIIAVVRYDRTDATTAEVAFVVQDEWQGKGIATALLYHLAAYGRAHGFTRFIAITMGSNARMLEVLRFAGFPFHMRYIDGDVEASLDITAPPSPPFAPGGSPPPITPSPAEPEARHDRPPGERET